MPKSSYIRSKGVETVDWREHPLGRGLALAILDESTAAGRQARGQALLDLLNEAAGLPPCRLTVADRPQTHRRQGGRLALKTYGYYRVTWDDQRQPRGAIRIYHLTAIRRQTLSAKVFLETLLHEWVHHYDFTGLGLDRSPHTSGFFARIRHVAESLGVAFVVPPKRDLAPTVNDAPDVEAVDVGSLRPRGVGPPAWIREQINLLFGSRPAR